MVKSIDINALKTELLHLLQILYPFDRDFKTLVICLNPDHVFGSDNKLKPFVLTLLNNMQKNNIVETKKIKIKRYEHNQKKIIEIFSLLDQKSVT